MIDPIDISESSEAGNATAAFQGVRLRTRIPAARDGEPGDWCDAFALSQDVVALSIGDVCGHGSGKYAAKAALRQSIRGAARLGLDPAQILHVADSVLRGYDEEERATAICALLNVRRRSLTFANAGHCPPLMTGPIGTLFLEFRQTDLPLGRAAAILPALHVVNVPPSTLLLFHTDGVSELTALTPGVPIKRREATRFPRGNFPP
jgi:serine phosphatase RsbU (regulator of sigma subunit)